MVDPQIFLRLTYDYWRRTLPKYGIAFERVKVLECGIGPGHLFQFMEGWFPRASFFGLDIDPKVLSRVIQNGVPKQLLVASAEVLPFHDQSFDFIISFHMVEHLNYPERFLGESSRVLRSGGVLILATPNPEGLGARSMKSRWGSWIQEHVSLKPPHQWRKLLISYGFRILRDGTTGLSGIPAFRKLPLALFNWGPLFLFGFLPWQHGEAYICISQKGKETLPGVSLSKSQ